MVAFSLQQQSLVLAAETRWLTRPKIYTICLLTEKVCQPLIYSMEAKWQLISRKRETTRHCVHQRERHLPKDKDVPKESELESEQASRSNDQLTGNTKVRCVCLITSQECNQKHPHLQDKDPICSTNKF